MTSARHLSILFTGLAIATAAHADPQSIAERYPPGSITTLEQADAALAIVQQERTRAQADLLAAQKVCYAKFLASACLNEVKARDRDRNADIDAVDLMAHRFKRQQAGDEAAAERKRHADERIANLPQDALQRTQRETSFGQKQNDAIDAAGKEDERRAGDAARAQSYGSKLAGAQQKQADEVKHRAQVAASADTNDKARADKLADASARHERLAKKHAQKEADRARKAAEQAAGNKPGVPPGAAPSAPAEGTAVTAPAPGAPTSPPALTPPTAPQSPAAAS